MLLVHDLLLSKKGLSAPQAHPLSVAVTRHKARLNAELTKQRIFLGYHSLEALRECVNEGGIDQSSSEATKVVPHPRWIRINALKTSLTQLLETTFKGYQQVDNLEDILAAPAAQKSYFMDNNVPDLIALPPRAEIPEKRAYESGEIIFQDKASCFPAYLLDLGPDGGDVIDACAAPGNKTTHLAALSSASLHGKPIRKIFAFERDRQRIKTLQKMVSVAAASKLVTIAGAIDFLQTSSSDDRYANVTAILLDPSCSGSGIVGRDDEPVLHLPTITATAQSVKGTKSKKRKREQQNVQEERPKLAHENDTSTAESETQLSERLEALSTFQLKLLQHAMTFPSARKIVYSTCSVHFQENEGVVISGFLSKSAKQRGWRLLSRAEQVSGLRQWDIRGDEKGCEQLLAGMNEPCILGDAGQIADSCVRCEKGTTAGTMGFFVAGFVRDDTPERSNPPHQADTGDLDGEEIEEWNGFSDTE